MQTAHRNYYQSTHFKQYLITIIREIIPNVSYKLSSDESFQVIPTNYCQKNHSKHYLVTIIRESFETSLLNYYLRVIAKTYTWKILSEKSFQTILTNYYKRNHWKQYLQTIIIKSFLTILTSFYQKNHWKHLLLTITRKIIANKPKNLLGNHFKQYTYVHTIIREIIPNKSYKLVQEKSLPTVLTYYYQRIISNNTYKLLPKKWLQTALTKVYQIIQFILNNTSYL